MQENRSSTTSARSSGLPQFGNAPIPSTPLISNESAALTCEDTVLIAGVAEPPAPTEAGKLLNSSDNSASPAGPAPLLANQTDGGSEKPMVKWKGIEEVVRTGNAAITSCQPPFEAEEGCESDITAIVERAELVRSPFLATPVPTGSAPYGTIDDLFMRIQDAIAVQNFLSDEATALLTYWSISTWFSDGLPLAPGLAITGSAQMGDGVLRTLRNFCHYPFLLAGISITSLKKMTWSYRPTILSFEPNLSKLMASFLGCSTRRGYLVDASDGFRDYYGAKAIYAGEDLPAVGKLLSGIHVIATATTTAAPRFPESTVVPFQNQLLSYRLKNLVKVEGSNFNALTLPSDMRPLANALGACIVDSPKLQSKLISLLTPVAEQRDADRSTSLEGVTLEATLNLCHEGKSQMLVSEITAEVNFITKGRGERLIYNAETIGHQLKKVGLFTRRLGKAGKGLTMDLATITRAHELAGVYGGAGLKELENNLHCPLCTENK
jgi:hypothetical protein